MTTPMSRADRQRMVLISLLASLAVWVYYGYVLKPLVRAVAEVSQAGRMARGQLREIEQAFTQEPELHQQHRQLEQEVAHLREVIPTEEELPTVIERLTELGGQTGVKLQLIAPQRPLVSTNTKESSTGLLYTEIPIQLDALGGFHQFGAFLSLVEQGEHPMQLRSLRISENPKLLRRHVVKMILVAYVMPSRKAAADRAGTILAGDRAGKILSGEEVSATAGLPTEGVPRAVKRAAETPPPGGRTGGS